MTQEGTARNTDTQEEEEEEASRSVRAGPQRVHRPDPGLRVQIQTSSGAEARTNFCKLLSPRLRLQNKTNQSMERSAAAGSPRSGSSSSCGSDTGGSRGGGEEEEEEERKSCVPSLVDSLLSRTRCCCCRG
ncbi:unnamed protein product [Pleuronectes platessa]|uniref:Uncharacterized protein n=1 Tax=Pleuronectes platessa TaxID=8262 RepID=A0A9N7YIT2_PLEPL|nr:unnamed protein product [Pleuronectes platessa]